MNLQPIIDQINEMNTSELISLNNTYCSENSIEGEIYTNDEEFFEMYFTNSYDALQRTHFGNYNWNDDYCTINGYGNVDSMSSIDTSDLVENVETIAEYLYDNQRNFSHLDIDFDECEEEEEEI
jgi:hypothetical protein